MKLFLCEKPSQARDIGRVLGVTKRGDGFLTANDNGTMITWGFGHLLEMSPPEGYGEQFKHWKLETLPIIPDKWQLVVKASTKKQFSVVNKLIKKATTVIIATDADREGETIARELLDYCKYGGNIQRLWLSALDDASIRKALNTLKPNQETYPLYLAGLARARADWLVGMNMTRIYTIIGRKAGFNSLLSVGRVQTPTLKLVVERDKSIAHFTPQSYWTLRLNLKSSEGSFIADWQPATALCDAEGRCINHQVIQQVAQRVQQSGRATVVAIETKRSKESAPLAFDLGTLQQLCSKKWGFGAQQVLDIVQSLYETHKATTYPRTDCGYLPESMRTEVPQVLAALANTDPQLSSIIDMLDLTFQSRIWNDKKITAHHGIIPTMQSADLKKMSTEEKQVFYLICHHYFAQFLPLHEADKTEVLLQAADQHFIAKGKTVIVNGWKRLFSKDLDQMSTSDDQHLPVLSTQQSCSVDHVDMRSLQTKPPEKFTEGTLIAAMKNASRYVTDERLKQRLKETSGIGTEATRAGIIETLIKRGYLIKQKRFLVTNELAHNLINIIPPVIKDVGMTALWEQALDDIATGQLPLDEFMQKQNTWITTIVEYAKQQKL